MTTKRSANGKRTALTFYADDEMASGLKKLAKAMDRSLTYLVRLAIAEYISKNSKKAS